MNKELRLDKLFLFDLDGTLYTGDRLHEGVVDLLVDINKSGGKYVFLSNNSSRSVEDYIKKFKDFGIDTKEEDFYLSTHHAAAFINEKHPGQKVFTVGSSSCIRELVKCGVDASDDMRGDETVILLAYDTELTYKKLYDATYLLDKGVIYYATHPDMLCPTEFGLVPDCGTFIDMLYTATGRRPKVFGKPDPGMALNVAEKFGYSIKDTVMVGDRLYTDLKCGIDSGAVSVLLLSGETTREMYEDSDLIADHVFDDINSLYLSMKK